MIRIKDIAQEAGVSPTTVSNVIHGNTKKVSADTIEKIRKLLEKHSYVPSMGALMLASSSSRIIGVLVGGRKDRRSTVESDAFTNLLIRSLEAEIYRRGYYMLLHFSDSARDHLSFAAAWKVEGLITLGLPPGENRTLCRESRIPMVSIDVYYEDDPVPNVGLNDYYGGYLMADYLLAQGHRRILFLADNDTGVDHERFLGVLAAFDQAGIPFDGSGHLLIPADKQERMDYYREHLPSITASCDALFFASDYYALEATCCLREQDYRIPQDISVAGFDDNECALLCCPRLTTVHQDVPQKAVAATGKLFSIIRGEPDITLSEKLPVHLVVRDSVKTDSGI